MHKIIDIFNYDPNYFALWPEVIVLVRLLCTGQIDLFADYFYSEGIVNIYPCAKRKMNVKKLHN